MIENAPKYIQDRFYQMRNYVWHELFPGDKYLQKLKRCLTKEAKSNFKKNANELVDEVAIVMLIFVLKRFFQDGTKIAMEAADIYSKLDLDGFSVGGVHFKGRNENVMMGEVLSNILLVTLSPEIRELIQDKEHPYQIIEMYRNYVREL